MTQLAQKSEAPLAGGAVAGESADKAPIVADQGAAHKRFATLAAQFALCGHAFVKARGDDTRAPYYLMRWGWIKPIASLDAAERFLRQIGGAR